MSVLLPLASVPPAHGQAFPGAPDERAANLRIYPADVWGHRVGPGLGIGMVAHNLARQYDQWLLTVAPARYEQAATLSFASAAPREARRYILLDTRALHTDRDWYGPPDNRITLRRTSLRARARFGQVLADRRLLIQPHVSLISQNVTDVQAPGSLPVDGLNANAISTDDARHTGVRTGINLRFDTRRQPRQDKAGLRLQGTWDRYLPLDDTRLQFDQVDLDAYGFLPFNSRHRLVLRAAATLTRTRTDAPVPIYMLPTIGTAEIPGWARRRFVGPDRLLGSMLYRFPLWRYDEVLTVEGHVGAHVGSVYQNLGTQFTPSIRFDETIPAGIEPPLRPAASVGLRLATPLRSDVELDLALGISPEGVSAVQFSVVRRLQALRLPHHTTTTIR